jgi:hypothetical protein
MSRDTRVVLLGVLCGLVTVGMAVFGYNFVSRGLKAAQKAEMPKVKDFARRYTAAWCSSDAASVAAFFAPEGSLSINNGAPAKGRAAITAAVQSFMTALPDMEVVMKKVDVLPFGVVTYYWSLRGTNDGPGGTGKRVHISGFEVWHFGADGLLEFSQGHFDEAQYKRQLEHGIGEDE